MIPTSSSEKTPLAGKEEEPRQSRWCCQPRFVASVGLLILAMAIGLPFLVRYLRSLPPPSPPAPPEPPPSPPAGPPPPFGEPLCGSGVLKGFGLTSFDWQPEVRRAVLRLRCMGGNAVLIRIPCQQPTLSSLRPVCPPPSDFASLADVIARLRCMGMRVGVQTELHSQDGVYSKKLGFGVWAAYIGSDVLGGANFSTADWSAWGAAWAAQVVPWAVFAEAQSVSLLSVGAELSIPQRQPSVWREVVASVRGVFSGNLTYAADKGSNARVTWWGALDFIGADPYYEPLGPGDNPTTDELNVAWADKSKELWDATARYHRPVLVHEIGFRSYTGSNQHPGAWQPTGPVNNGLQDRLFSTMLHTMCPKSTDEFAGLFVMGLSTFSTNPIGYELTGKPAIDTVARAWGGVADVARCSSDVVAAFEWCNTSTPVPT